MRFRIISVAAAVAALWMLPASSQAEECVSDADCAEGEICLFTPCAAPCDPDDETCEPLECPGVCTEDPGPAFEECLSDEDCPDGFVCEMIGGVACAGVVCPDGETCPEPPPCEPEEIYGCVPAPPPPCESDEDCDEGLVCVTYEYTMCSGGTARDCPPDVECPEPEPSPPPECTEESESYCVPPYFAPCTEDADCGEGFSCVEVEMCACSGGGVVGDSAGSGEGTGSGGSSTDPPPPDTPPDCTCEPTGEFYCELDEMPCDSEVDCPADFACEEMPASTVPCFYDEETGETSCEEPPPPESAGYCVPADWNYWFGSGDSAAGSSSREGYDEAVADAIGGDAESAQASGRASDLDNPPGGFPDVTPEDPGSGDESGCRQGPGTTAPAGMLLFALAALATCRRRRRSVVA